MLRKPVLLLTSLLVLSITLTFTLLAQGPRRIPVGDWPEIRGPQRDGTSRETGLIDKWVPNGENFLWRAPYGGRSAPIVVGNRVYVQNPSGRGENLQERIMALDTETGRVIWEYKVNLFQSDAPAHRIGWASPAADPETGNIYALTGGAQAVALSPQGRLLWTRSLGEEWAAFTTHGGRTMSPIVDGDLVIVSAAISSWGTSANRTHRLVAFDAGQGGVLLLFQAGATSEDLTDSRGTVPGHEGVGRLHMAFAVAAEDLPAWRQRLAELGLPLAGEVRWSRGGTSLYIRDPDGHAVEFATPGLWPNR